MKYAILIDGGFLRRKLRPRGVTLAAAHVESFLAAIREHEAVAGMRLHRVYWYDAPPLHQQVIKPLRGGGINFGGSSVARSNARLLGKLSELPFFAMRQGDLVFRGWTIDEGKLPLNEGCVTLTAEDLKPNVHQKGVDMRLGLDSDFVPAMKFARREGAQIFLLSLGHPLRPEMRAHADLILDMDPSATEVGCAAVPP